MKPKIRHALAVLGTAPVLWLCTPQDPAETPPVDVFHELDGTWAGTFVGYDETGAELYRIAVRQTYRTVDDHTQEVTIRDTMPDGKVIEGQGRNTAHRGADGQLVLRCEVIKSTGETVEHDGRLVTGPTGREELVWYSRSEDRVETFREWVFDDNGTRTYAIHGMGRYGGQLMLMAGEYRKQK